MAERMKDWTGQYLHDLKEVGGRLWGATQRTVGVAGERAGHYGRLVQQKLDLAVLERKIAARREELGKSAFAAWKAGESDLLRQEDVVLLIGALDDLDREREALEREIGEFREKGASAPEGRAPPRPEADPREAAEEERHL